MADPVLDRFEGLLGAPLQLPPLERVVRRGRVRRRRHAAAAASATTAAVAVIAAGVAVGVHQSAVPRDAADQGEPQAVVTTAQQSALLDPAALGAGYRTTGLPTHPSQWGFLPCNNPVPVGAGTMVRQQFSGGPLVVEQLAAYPTVAAAQAVTGSWGAAMTGCASWPAGGGDSAAGVDGRGLTLTVATPTTDRWLVARESDGTADETFWVVLHRGNAVALVEIDGGTAQRAQDVAALAYDRLCAYDGGC